MINAMPNKEKTILFIINKSFDPLRKNHSDKQTTDYK